MIEGEFGFYGLIEAAGDTGRLLEEWTRPWRVTQISHKPFPSGRATHSAIDGTLRLRRHHDFCADEVESLVVQVPPMIKHLCSRPMVADATPNYLRLCIPYQIAGALTDGFVDLTTVRPERLVDPLFGEHADKVEIVLNDTTDPNAFSPQTVTITLEDGARYSLTVSELPALRKPRSAPRSACTSSSPASGTGPRAGTPSAPSASSTWLDGWRSSRTLRS